MIMGIITACLMLGFIGLCLWVYRPSAKSAYHEASILPLQKTHEHQSTAQGSLS